MERYVVSTLAPFVIGRVRPRKIRRPLTLRGTFGAISLFRFISHFDIAFFPFQTKMQENCHYCGVCFSERYNLKYGIHGCPSQFQPDNCCFFQKTYYNLVPRLTIRRTKVMDEWKRRNFADTASCLLSTSSQNAKVPGNAVR